MFKSENIPMFFINVLKNWKDPEQFLDIVGVPILNITELWL